MKKQMEWSQKLLSTHPKTKLELEKWVYKQLEKVQQEIALEAGVIETPKLDDEKAKQYLPYSLAGNPDYFLEFFDENKMYISIMWEEKSKLFLILLTRTVHINLNLGNAELRQEAVYKAIEILFDEYEKTK